jgi:hypothetical protein
MTTNTAELAQITRQSLAALTRAAKELGDKIIWRPLDKGRSALDQLQEVAGMAVFGKMIFETQTVPAMGRETFEQFRAEYDTPEKVFAVLEKAGEEYAQAIEALPEEKLTHVVTLPFGGGMKKTLAEFALLNYWNTVYHEGQINYIQTLCAEE